MTQIIQKFITQPSTLMGSWNESSNVKEFYGDRSPSFNAGAIIRFTAVRDTIASTSTRCLKIANGALWIYGCEPSYIRERFVSKCLMHDCASASQNAEFK
jgi:hypothetical protein